MPSTSPPRGRWWRACSRRCDDSPGAGTLGQASNPSIHNYALIDLANRFDSRTMADGEAVEWFRLYVLRQARQLHSPHVANGR